MATIRHEPRLSVVAASEGDIMTPERGKLKQDFNDLQPILGTNIEVMIFAFV